MDKSIQQYLNLLVSSPVSKAEEIVAFSSELLEMAPILIRLGHQKELQQILDSWDVNPENPNQDTNWIFTLQTLKVNRSVLVYLLGGSLLDLTQTVNEALPTLQNTSSSTFSFYAYLLKALKMASNYSNLSTSLLISNKLLELLAETSDYLSLNSYTNISSLRLMSTIISCLTKDSLAFSHWVSEDERILFSKIRKDLGS